MRHNTVCALQRHGMANTPEVQMRISVMAGLTAKLQVSLQSAQACRVLTHDALHSCGADMCGGLEPLGHHFSSTAVLHHALALKSGRVCVTVHDAMYLPYTRLK